MRLKQHCKKESLGVYIIIDFHLILFLLYKCANGYFRLVFLKPYCYQSHAKDIVVWIFSKCQNLKREIDLWLLDYFHDLRSVISCPENLGHYIIWLKSFIDFKKLRGENIIKGSPKHFLSYSLNWLHYVNSY